MTYKIFKGKGNQKLVFSMIPCPERNALKKIIFKYGGVLFTKRKEYSICLLPYEPGHTSVCTQKYKVYSYKFIYDSIKAKRLLDLSKYELKREEPKAAKRSRYTIEDEEKMLDYVKRTFGNTGVISFWDGIVKEGVKHSSESLRYHWKYVMNAKEKVAAELIMNENIKAEFMIAQNASKIPIQSKSPLETDSSEGEDTLDGLEAKKKTCLRENEKTPNKPIFLENQLKRKNEGQIKGQKALKLLSQCQRNLISKPLDKIYHQNNLRLYKKHCVNPEILFDVGNSKEENEIDFSNKKTNINQDSENAQVAIKKEKEEPSCDSERYYNNETQNSFNIGSEQRATTQECIKTEIYMQNNQHKLKDFVDDPEDLFIVCDSQIRSVHRLKSLKHLCIDVNIEEHFNKLFSLCKKVSKRIITEDDVLHALETKNGVVSDTISFFLDKKIGA
ncbi:unnamed protein product [Blepharisma stoltei]|uniref:BRCT domain-containing protein n=1 Tax=Blepharisma stoltei TaxID=1481888 RepID=A0AAU9JIF1_9CILI|nr:unnamed protein product [Blepharisma stoltei]